MANDTAVLKLNVDPTPGVAGLKRFKRNADGVSSSAATLTKRLVGIGVAFIGIRSVSNLFKDSFRDAVDYNRALGETLTLIEGTAKQTEILDKAAKNLSATYGGSVVEKQQALYQTISSGITDVTEATLFANEANKLAIAGNTDLTSSVNLLTSVINVYGKDTITAARASDILFETVRRGKTTIPGLEASLGRLLPMAKAVGITFEEVSASMATLTARGISESESITGLRAIYQSILKPSSEATKLFKQFGIDVGVAAIKSKGFRGVLEDINISLGGSEELWSLATGSVDAFSSVMALGGDAFKLYDDNLKGAINSTGATADATQKQVNRMSFLWDRLKAIVDLQFLDIGTALLETLVPVFQTVSDSMSVMFEDVNLGETIEDMLKSSSLAVARFLDVVSPALNIVGGWIQQLWDNFKALPAWVQSVGLVGAFLGGRLGKGIFLGLLAAPTILEKFGVGEDTRENRINKYALGMQLEMPQGSYKEQAEFNKKSKEFATAQVDFVDALLSTMKELTDIFHEEIPTIGIQAPSLSEVSSPDESWQFKTIGNEVGAFEEAVNKLWEGLGKKDGGVTAQTPDDLLPTTIIPDELKIVEASAKEAAEAKKAYFDLREQIDLVHVETMQFEAGQKVLNDALRTGAISADVYKEQMRLLDFQVRGVGFDMRTAKENMLDWTSSTLRGIRSLSDAFRSLGDMIADKLIRGALDPLLDSLLGIGSTGGGGLLGGFFGWLFNAKGNVFNNGELVPFAKGGVVSSSLGGRNIDDGGSIIPFAKGGVVSSSLDESKGSIVPFAKGGVVSSSLDESKGSIVPFAKGGVVSSSLDESKGSIVPFAKGGVVSSSLGGKNIESKGSIVPFAKGGVVSSSSSLGGGSIIPFAKGGVVTSPTFFPLKGGKTGVAGEAGAEAILPLKRGRGGKLGVEVMGRSGGGGGDSGTSIYIPLTVNIDAAGADPAALARVTNSVDNLQKSLPNKIIRTVQGAKRAKVL